MSQKGDRTRRLILKEAYGLFVEKGFRDVTMKDVCDRTGLSRGGLYRHYGSTGEIFSQIMAYQLERQGDEFAEKIAGGEPAAQILDDVLERYESEMLDRESSLSLAIYEFFSSPEAGDENALLRQYQRSQRMWKELLEYGMRTGEFRQAPPEELYDLLVFSYQGVRMYSRLMPLPPSVPAGIVRQIKVLLLQKDG